MGIDISQITGGGRIAPTQVTNRPLLTLLGQDSSIGNGMPTDNLTPSITNSMATHPSNGERSAADPVTGVSPTPRHTAISGQPDIDLDTPPRGDLGDPPTIKGLEVCSFIFHIVYLYFATCFMRYIRVLCCVTEQR